MTELDDGKLPEDLKEVIHRIASDAEDMELKLSEYKFVHSSRMLGIAVGGAIFVIGLLFSVSALFLLPNVFELPFHTEVRLAIASVAGIIGGLQLMAGVLLMGK